jgi:hypothetical protein
MKIKEIFAGSLLFGKLPEGCKYCVEGSKLVLFVTGLCKKNCWYCTISKKRWQNDITLANEIEVKKDSEILKEAKLIDARGAGITGGEPIVVLDKTLHYIDFLKSEFGQNFHIHMYTAYPIDKQRMKKLYEHGLDEIRFHFFDENWDVIENALKFNWDVGIEIPVIPEYEEKIKKILLKADELGIKFINLNELEFSERNETILLGKNYEIKDNAPTAVKESEEVAKRLLEFSEKNVKKLSVHYCSAMTKNVFQLRNRWKRRAENIKENYEKVNDDGLLEKCIIEVNEKDITPLLNNLRKKYRLSSNVIKMKNNVIETSFKIGLKIAKKNSKLKIFFVKQIPIENGWYMEKWPIESLLE